MKTADTQKTKQMLTEGLLFDGFKNDLKSWS